MKRKDDIWEGELLSQQKVAQHFGVTENTIKNWRKRGLLSFFQAPGSTRILYFKDEVYNFIKSNIVYKKYNLIKAISPKQREKPVNSSKLQNEDWRI